MEIVKVPDLPSLMPKPTDREVVVATDGVKMAVVKSCPNAC
jgi:hypothetical protein